MRKSSQELNKKSPMLVLSEGKWANFRQKPQHEYKLSKFTGLLYLQDNDEPKILVQIAKIQFNNLIKLSLEANNIQSIEPIANFYCPKLVELQLGDNKIVNIKSLRKTNFQHLKVLSLRKNKIIQFQPLQQLYSIIRNAFIEWYDDEGYCPDASWVLKMETFQFKQLWLESRVRIVQKKVFEQIQKKYPLLKFSYNKMKG